MQPKSIELFVDTNAFIHLRDLKDLPWQEIFPDANRVDIFVASRVIEELDKLKNWPNGRKRDRARLALKLIESASKADNYSLLIRQEPIEVRIVIANGPPPVWSEMPRLDPLKPDDQLVAEVAAYGNDAVLFSYDTGPRIRARLANLSAVEPSEDWHLPLEKTEDQRKVSELERRLERALSIYPTIFVSIGESKGENSVIDLSVPLLEPINHHLVERLTAAYLADHPREHLTLRQDHPLGWAYGGLGKGYSEHEIETYEREFSAYRNKVRDYFAGLHDSIHRVAHAPSIDYVVQNSSGISAAGLRIEASLSGEATLLSSKNASQKFVGTLEPPKCPKKPTSAHDAVSQYLRQSIAPISEPRDPTGFYWLDRPTYPSKHSALQCEDFRATRIFKDKVLFWIERGVPFAGGLSLHVSATNLSAPVIAAATINVKERAVDWSDEIVLKLLPDEIRDLLQKTT